VRLFGVPSGSVSDNDRAAWLTMPFDFAWPTAITFPIIVSRAEVFAGGAIQAEVFAGGAIQGEVLSN